MIMTRKGRIGAAIVMALVMALPLATEANARAGGEPVGHRDLSRGDDV